MQGSEADALRTPVSAAYARALVRTFGKTRSERDALLKGTAIQQDALDQPGAHMPVSSLVMLAANITQTHGELWPLSAAAVWSTSLQGALDVATRTAPTIADALNTGARFGSTRAPFIRNLLDTGAVEMAEAQLQIEHYWAGALRRAVIDGDVETGSVMAGQSVGMVNREEPVAAIMQELVDEAAAALESRG